MSACHRAHVAPTVPHGVSAWLLALRPDRMRTSSRPDGCGRCCPRRVPGCPSRTSSGLDAGSPTSLGDFLTCDAGRYGDHRSCLTFCLMTAHCHAVALSVHRPATHGNREAAVRLDGNVCVPMFQRWQQKAYITFFMQSAPPVPELRWDRRGRLDPLYLKARPTSSSYRSTRGRHRVSYV